MHGSVSNSQSDRSRANLKLTFEDVHYPEFSHLLDRLIPQSPRAYSEIFRDVGVRITKKRVRGLFCVAVVVINGATMSQLRV